MNAITAPRAAALSLATLITLATLGSINLLATQPSPDLQMAATSAPAQVIVITGKRLHA
jgi:hypothetical protein